jgi:D-beta-D-heptose 7-phosphate kinase / D-beta-D-heptose 1-phosphate adenosyltransferase
MATIFVNGCFDLLHEGHRRFLFKAGELVRGNGLMVVAINSDSYARELKCSKWGDKYPIDDWMVRERKLRSYCDCLRIFDSEAELRLWISDFVPCIICKGPDYAGRESEVTGADIAPVLILDTPETDEIREFKRKAYML